MNDDAAAIPTIYVTEEYTDEVPASGAKLFVDVQGSKLFTSKAAVTEAAEVRRLVDALVAVGCAADDVALTNVRIDVTRGVFKSASSATYNLRVACTDPQRLPAMLDAVSDQKNCTLSRIVWEFDGIRALRSEWLALCAGRARTKAAAIARALDLQLDGVLRLVEETPGDADVRVHHFGMLGGAMPQRARASAESELGGLELAPTRAFTVRVNVHFKVR